MTFLIELKAPKQRFARSINVERDAGSSAIEGYLPVGRAIESIDRLARALANPHTEAAMSVTGPYGSGKSSLALLLDSLLAPKDDPARRAAAGLLKAAAPQVLESVRSALTENGAWKSGFIRCVATAQREPVAATVLRALLNGSQRFAEAVEDSAELRALIHTLEKLLADSRRGDPMPDARTITSLVTRLTSVAPVLLLVDEFGKNLEAFAESPGDGDLYLLQELAEWTRGGRGNRFALVTLQHMAFGDYADGASGLQRREWVKVQGRFEDVPFMDTPDQTRSLVAAAFDEARSPLSDRLATWEDEQAERLSVLGLRDLATPGLLRACWPLHPTSLAVLPDLCQRYGQNERTMFSFLAGDESLGVPQFLRGEEFRTNGELVSVRLARLYDYFLESAASMVGVSADASRWIEIDSRIRDAYGLSPGALRVLKSVGLLNLVSAGGSLRASRPMIAYACMDGESGTENEAAVTHRLSELETAGLITFRDFADEFRVWHGSDFDLKGAIDVARRRLRDEPDEVVLQRVMPLSPVVAARHAHTSGTLRTFDRTWISPTSKQLGVLSADDRSDGLVAFVLGDSPPTDLVSPARTAKPVVMAISGDTEQLLDAARELMAVDEVLTRDENARTDWVVRKELAERRVASSTALKWAFEQAYGGANALFWWSPPAAGGHEWCTSDARTLSGAISEVCDAYYTSALPFRNELINRHELTSQAAKARRELAERMWTHQNEAYLGIEGFGPDKTLALSLLDAFGFHREIKGVGWQFSAPSKGKGATQVWTALVAGLRAATAERVNVAEIYTQLTLPPFGLRAGPAPILMLSALIALGDELALYEHGTFRPRLTGDVCERLLKNPRNFEVKCFASNSGQRQAFVQHASAQLGLRVSPRERGSSVVSAVGSLVAQVNMLPAYAKRTAQVSPAAAAVRNAILRATEPDVLLFEDIPAAFGEGAIPANEAGKWKSHEGLASALGGAVEELVGAYAALLAAIRASLVEHLRADGSELQGSLTRRALELRDKVLDGRLKALVTALHAEMPDEEAWLAYVAMQVTGVPPEGWSDDDRRRFDASVQDLGSSMLRIEAMNADLRAAGGGFEALRLSINSTGGGDLVRLIQVDPHRRAEADDVIDELLAQHGALDPGAEGASDWLLARLLERELERQAAAAVGARTYAPRVTDSEESA